MTRIRYSGFLGVRMALAAIAVAACSTPDVPNEGEVDQDVLVTNCTQPMPPVPINFDRELVIHSKYVVEDGVAGDGNDEANDHCRTSWTGCTSTTMGNQGHWTFGYMMAAMAGTSDPTSSIATSFVRDWLKRWLSSQQPNLSKTAAAPRTAITEVLIQPWLNASGCPAAATLDSCALDLKKAPFRLLTFVNRIDLPKVTGYSTGGEFRAVFGAIGADPVNCPGCPATQTLNATVILEYSLPSTKTLKQWADQLHELSSYNPGNNPPGDLTQTLTYRSKLQTLTDAIVGPNASPSGPFNHSAIAHVRTNESVFDCQMGSANCNGVPPNPGLAVWEMRQFKLSGPFGTASGASLVQDTVSQTPQSSDSRTTAINNLLINHHAAINNGDVGFQNTDNALLGNASQTQQGPSAIVWEWAPAPAPPVLNSTNAPDLTMPSPAVALAQARHLFGLGTCNGCHYAETNNQAALFHIYPRDQGMESQLSSFLSAGYVTNPIAPADSSNLAPLSKHTVNDQAVTGVKFFYNEPWRRACEIRRILSGSTTPATKPSGHLMPPPVCHATCSTGLANDALCDSCTTQICAVDSFCCASSWDSICVGEVASVCHQTCP